MRTARPFVISVLLGILAAAGASAADQPVAAQGDATTVAPIEAAPALPDLPENAAEIEALKSDAPSGPAPAEALPGLAAERPEAELSPRMQVLRSLLAAEEARLAELQSRLDAAPDAAAALAIQREIERVKQQTEVELLAAQAGFAREAGQEEKAAAIEAAIDELTSPRPRGVPQDRPAPVETQR